MHITTGVRQSAGTNARGSEIVDKHQFLLIILNSNSRKQFSINWVGMKAGQFRGDGEDFKELRLKGLVKLLDSKWMDQELHMPSRITLKILPVILPLR